MALKGDMVKWTRSDFVKIFLPATKYLHAQEGKDEDEQNEQNQQSVDRGDGVDQRLHQVTHRRPVSRHKQLY